MVYMKSLKEIKLELKQSSQNSPKKNPKIEQENDKEVEDFYQEVVHMGNTFRSWLTEL